MKLFDTKSLAVLCAPFLLLGCERNVKKENDSRISVKVATVSGDAEVRDKKFSFISKPYRSSELSFRVGGPIRKFEVFVGGFYRKGELIAEVDSRDFKIRKEKAEAIFNQSEAEFERINVLYEKNNISASAYEKVNADYIAAKLAFETALNELKDTRLIAPFDGYVSEVFIEEYQDVKPTQPVITFVDIERLRIEAYVTQDIAFESHRINKVNLSFDALPNTILEGELLEVSKNTSRNNLSYLLTAVIPNPDNRYLAGMSGNLSFNLSAPVETSLVIPQIALCQRPTAGTYVWVVNPETKRVSQRRVVVEQLLPDGNVSVTKGIEKGDQVAISSLRFLSDEMEVEIHGAGKAGAEITKL
ncbi:MAG: efflux RND transporter periplasmic adaptor subunit [Bacteroidales bacterium]